MTLTNAAITRDTHENAVGATKLACPMYYVTSHASYMLSMFTRS